MEQPKKSIFRRASEWGIPFGLYLALAGIASLFADHSVVLNFIFMLMLIGTPLLVYRYQRRMFIEDNGFTEYAGLWMLGIMLFIMGAVIASFIVYLVLQYGRPTFMQEQAQMVIDAYSQIPQMQDSEMLHVIQRMVDEHLLPSPIEVVFNAYWFITCGGSFLSAITALLARRAIPSQH